NGGVLMLRVKKKSLLRMRKAGFSSEGMKRGRKDGKFGALNQKGKEGVPCIYDEIGFFKEGLGSSHKRLKAWLCRQNRKNSCSFYL
ncbi:MAG: WG repeat-containing protein, partial [Flavobacterium sp.]|nr:WG repeat-containing protein [Flavobacterium sp.]